MSGTFIVLRMWTKWCVFLKNNDQALWLEWHDSDWIPQLLCLSTSKIDKNLFTEDVSVSAPGHDIAYASRFFVLCLAVHLHILQAKQCKFTFWLARYFFHWVFKPFLFLQPVFFMLMCVYICVRLCVRDWEALLTGFCYLSFHNSFPQSLSPF